jgi:hypothetical protein
MKKSILAWLSARPADANGLSEIPRGPLQSLAARYWWPRRAWIPRDEA